jgi:hypothetical protein
VNLFMTELRQRMIEDLPLRNLFSADGPLSSVDRMCESIREFGFKIPCLVRGDGEVARCERSWSARYWHALGPIYPGSEQASRFVAITEAFLTALLKLP